MQISNLTRGSVICNKALCAESIVDRTRGMIGRRFNDFDGMLFQKCAAIHMMFMSMSLDVIFLDANNVVVKVSKNVRPWLPFLAVPGAYATLELPVGTIESTGTQKGDLLSLS